MIENVLNDYLRYYEEVLRLCRETDDHPEESRFRYTAEGAWSMIHFLRNGPPELVEEMINRLREGRVEVSALFANEITNMCGHEELVRLIYPSFELKRLYGIPISCASITDIPGLSWGLPTILRLSLIHI